MYVFVSKPLFVVKKMMSSSFFARFVWLNSVP